MANQIPSVTADTTIVTVTIGGNDIGFADLIVQCTLATARPRSTTRAPPRDGSRPAARHGLLRDPEPGARARRVVVLGYPRIFSTASCFGTFGITSTERTKANPLADAIDQLSRDARAGLRVDL